MPSQHFTSSLKGIVELNNDAIEVANEVAYRHELKIDISGSTLIKRPHMAFDKNLLAILMGRTATASAPTTSGDDHAWIDASLGEGELENRRPRLLLSDTDKCQKQYTGLEKCLRKCAGILEVCATKAATTLNRL